MPLPISATYDKEYELPDNTFTVPDGFKSTDGWMSDKDSAATTTKYYSGGESVKNLTIKDGATVTLYANYATTDCVVKFLGVKDELLKKIPCNTGDTLNKSEVPATPIVSAYYDKDIYKEGYIVRAWYCNNILTSLDGYIIRESATFKAKYEPIKYTVKFNDGGCSGTLPSDIECVYDKEYDVPPNNLTESLYTMDGWRTSGSSYNIKYYKSPNKFKNLTTKDGDIVTLSPNTVYDTTTQYTITLTSEHGTLKDDEKSFKANSNSFIYQYNYSSYSRGVLPNMADQNISGYKFLGWALKGEEEAFSSYKKVTSDMEFVAKWTPYKITIRFERNCPSAWSYSDPMPNQEVYYGVSTPLNKNKFSAYNDSGTLGGRVYYAFIGWTNKSAAIAEGDKTYGDGDDITITGDNVHSDRNTLTLYAHWKELPISINVSIDAATQYDDIYCHYNESTKVLSASIRGYAGEFNIYIDDDSAAKKSVTVTDGDDAEFDLFSIPGLSIGIHSALITAVKDGVTYSRSFLIKIAQAK